MTLNDNAASYKGQVAVCIYILITITLFLVFVPDVYAAPTSAAIKSSLSEWRDHMSLHTPVLGIVKDAFRFLGWNLIIGLAYLANELSGAVSSIYGLLAGSGDLGLFTNSKVITLYQNMQPYIAMLFTVAIAFFGYWLIFKRADAQMATWQNLLIILLVLTAMPSIAAMFGDWTAKMSDGVRSTYMSNMKEPATGIILSNVIDLYHIDQTGEVPGDRAFPSYKELAVQDITASSGTTYIGEYLNSWNKLSVIDINQLSDSRSNIKNTEFFKKKLELDENGKYTVVDLDQTMLPVNNSYYYMYSVKWWTCIFSLMGLILCLLFTCFKSGRLLFEALAQVFIMPAVAVTDLAGGQRIKEMIRHFVGIFATFFLISMILGLYFVGLQFLTYVYAAGSINGFVYVLLQFVLAFTVIDGPNVIERIVGIDAGIKSGYQALVGGAAIMSGISRGARDAGAAVKGIGVAGRGAVRAAVGNPFARNAQGRRVIGGAAGKIADLKAGRTDMQIKRKAKAAGVSFGDAAHDESLGRKGIYTAKQDRLDNEKEAIVRRRGVYQQNNLYGKLNRGLDNGTLNLGLGSDRGARDAGDGLSTGETESEVRAEIPRMNEADGKSRERTIPPRKRAGAQNEKSDKHGKIVNSTGGPNRESRQKAINPRTPASNARHDKTDGPRSRPRASAQKERGYVSPDAGPRQKGSGQHDWPPSPANTHRNTNKEQGPARAPKQPKHSGPRKDGPGREDE
jgi:hypothetical protein